MVTASIGADRWRSLPAAELAPLRCGRIYSTAALLAEGDAELTAWHADGFAAVDMETAATFAVAEHFGMDRGSILFVFDNPRRQDHMLLLDDDKLKRRDRANRQMIDFALAMVRQHAAGRTTSTQRESTHEGRREP